MSATQGLMPGLLFGAQLSQQQNAEALAQQRLEMAKAEAAERAAERQRQAGYHATAASVIGAPGAEQHGPVRPGEVLPTAGGSGLLGGALTPRQAAMKLLTVPGYQQTAVGLLGQQGQAAEREAMAEHREATRKLQERQLDETVRHHKASEMATAAKLRADLAEHGSMDIDDVAKAEKLVRGKVGQFDDMRNAMTRIKTFLETPGPISDLSATSEWARVLDPKSVIRESETRAINEAGGLASQLDSIMKRWGGSGSMPDEVRAEMAGLVNQLGAIYESEYTVARSSADDLLRRGSLDDATRADFLGAFTGFPQVEIGSAPAGASPTDLHSAASPGNIAGLLLSLGVN